MDIKDYFEKKKGLGVLSTADGNGIVNSAIYARPHVMEAGSLAFIMRDRLTHKNIQTSGANSNSAHIDPDSRGRKFRVDFLIEPKNVFFGKGSKRKQISGFFQTGKRTSAGWWVRMSLLNLT